MYRFSPQPLAAERERERDTVTHHHDHAPSPHVALCVAPISLVSKPSDGITADHPVAVGAVLHGAGVGPSLSVGCSLVVPALWTERPLLDMHSGPGLDTNACCIRPSTRSNKSGAHDTLFDVGPYHLQHVARSRLNSSPQGVMLVHYGTRVGCQCDEVWG